MADNYIFIGDNKTVMESKEFNSVVSPVDTIYIDVPYNTDSSLSYNDSREETHWLSFMKERLLLGKKLLKETGSIFISVDDNELYQLKLLCDEVFGRNNFLGTFITKQSQRSNAKHINTIHEYVLSYAKDKKSLPAFKIKRMELPDDRKMIEKISSLVFEKFVSEGREEAEKLLSALIKKNCEERNISWLKNYSNVDENGNIYFAKDLSTPGKPREVNIEEINLHLKPLKTRGWSSDKKFISLYKEGLLCFKNGRPYEKHFLKDSEDNAPSILDYYSRQGTNDLKKLGLYGIFDTPKPVALIKFLIRLSTPKDGVVLDFFAGSGTTAQAVYELNSEEKTKRNYVLIQIEEKVRKKSPVYAICQKHNIKPLVSEILKYRINKFLELSNGSDTPVIISVGGDC